MQPSQVNVIVAVIFTLVSNYNKQGSCFFQAPAADDGDLIGGTENVRASAVNGYDDVCDLFILDASNKFIHHWIKNLMFY